MRHVAVALVAWLLPVTGGPVVTSGADGEPCPDVGPDDVPDRARGRSGVVADLDGDGADDRFAVYHDGGWRLRAELATGPSLDVAARHWTGRPLAAGAADVDGDGRDEVFVDPRDGGPARAIGLAVLVGCELREVTEPGRGAARFVYAREDRPSHVRVGVDCVDIDGDDAVEVVETESDGRTGEWSYLAHRLTGAEAVRSGAAQGTDERRRPAALRFASGVSCAGFEYP